jgi:hypothetical protein
MGENIFSHDYNEAEKPQFIEKESRYAEKCRNDIQRELRTYFLNSFLVLCDVWQHTLHWERYSAVFPHSFLLQFEVIF